MVNTTENGECGACLDAMLLSCGQVYPSVLNAAIELNLFQIIGQGNPKGMSPSEIASKLSNPQADTVHRLDRVLFLLASYSLLTCSSKKVCQDGRVERLYTLSPTGKCLLTHDDGDDDEEAASYAAVSKLCCHPTFVQVWQNLKQAIFDDDDEEEEEEDLYKKVNGITLSEYMETDPAFKLLYQKAMVDLSTIHMRETIAETYTGFEGLSTLVDVSGGTGKNLKMIISKYPSIKGINFDLPQVVQLAPSHPGITHVGGDIFQGIPEGDAIMIKGATSKWTDGQWIEILRNCHGSLKKEGKVIIIDVIMPEMPRATDADKYVAGLDAMFLQSGGKQRTMPEFESLAKRAGFSRCRLAASFFASALGVIELYKLLRITRKEGPFLFCHALQ